MLSPVARRCASASPFARLASTIARFSPTPKYSAAMAHNGVVYMTGQVPAPSALADARTQTKSVLANIDALLASAGSSREHILSATLLLTHLESDFATVNEEWLAWLGGAAAPARTTIGGVALADKAWRVEIAVIAAQGAKPKRAGRPLSAEQLAKMKAGREAAKAAKKPLA